MMVSKMGIGCSKLGASFLYDNTHKVEELLQTAIEGGVNFFDFINGYRIEEFKKLVRDPRYKNQTFLAIAFEVGFNSKTAFNRSFKKMTNQTPRDYFIGVGERLNDE